eukprot:5543622-Amphidinium_carterae.1
MHVHERVLPQHAIKSSLATELTPPGPGRSMLATRDIDMAMIKDLLVCTSTLPLRMSLWSRNPGSSGRRLEVLD